MHTLVSHGADINHHNHYGKTIALHAPASKLFNVVGELLAYSVVPDRRDTIINVDCEGRDVFGCLARPWAPPLIDEADFALLNLLEKYVFPLLDKALRKRIIEGGDFNGSTLLHYFAECVMLRCVEVLLLHDAPINTLKYCFKEDNRNQQKRSWYVTSLDMALQTRRNKLEVTYSTSE